MADKVNNEEYYDNLRQESYRAMLNTSDSCERPSIKIR